MYRVLYNLEGEYAQLPDSGIVNIGGTSSLTFSVNGRPLLFADGGSTDGTPGIPYFGLQSSYDASSNSTILLTQSKAFTIEAINGNTFTVDPLSGNVTISGNLSVLGLISGVGGSGGSSAGMFFIGVESVGNIGNTVYAPNTTPANRVLESVTVDANSIVVSLTVEGNASSYTPVVTIETIPPQPGGVVFTSVVENTVDRTYVVSATIDCTTSIVINATSSTGATASLVVNKAGFGPALSVLSINSLPGSQTELKAGDVVAISGAIANSATYAEILATGASSLVSPLSLGVQNSHSPGFKTLAGSFICGSGSGARTITARGRNALGTFGANFVSPSIVTLNQTYPTISARTIQYPGTQQALRDAQSASISANVSNFDSVQYSSSNNLAVTLPSVYGSPKVATRISGDYENGIDNYIITAVKASNGATTVAASQIAIANVAPTISLSMVGAPLRLFSSGPFVVADISPGLTINLGSARLFSAP
jgi:hypothetical protein